MPAPEVPNSGMVPPGMVPPDMVAPGMDPPGDAPKFPGIVPPGIVPASPSHAPGKRGKLPSGVIGRATALAAAHGIIPMTLGGGGVIAAGGNPIRGPADFANAGPLGISLGGSPKPHLVDIPGISGGPEEFGGCDPSECIFCK